MAAESMSEGKSRPRLRRWMVTSLAVVVVLIATLVGWTLYQNTYDIREEKSDDHRGIGAAPGSPCTARTR